MPKASWLCCAPSCLTASSPDPSGLAFDGDALTAYRQKPLVTVLPRTADEVSAVLAFAAEYNVPIVRAARGTSLSGGALPRGDGILLSLTRMNRILQIDLDNRCVVTEPGVTNSAITRAVEGHGFYYAPDPSSQIACTIGGNVAENSGGLHCLKYGLTTHNLLGVELALAGGERIRLGGKAPGANGLDIIGVVAGSEGLLGVVTEATLRILPKPPATRTLLAAFRSVPDAGQCVADIIAAGIVPAAMEFMDRRCIEAVEAHSAPAIRNATASSLSTPTGSRPRSITPSPPSATSRAGTAHRCARRPKNPNARALGRPQGPRFPRWAASRPTCSAWTARSRAASCPMCWRAWPRWLTITSSASVTSSMPATAISIPSSCSTR